jgi:hypothetical protein
MNHCLSALRTLAERLTPYVQEHHQWEDILPAIVFSINSSVHGW